MQLRSTCTLPSRDADPPGGHVSAARLSWCSSLPLWQVRIGSRKVARISNIICWCVHTSSNACVPKVCVPLSRRPRQGPTQRLKRLLAFSVVGNPGSVCACSTCSIWIFSFFGCYTYCLRMEVIVTNEYLHLQDQLSCRLTGFCRIAERWQVCLVDQNTTRMGFGVVTMAHQLFAVELYWEHAAAIWNYQLLSTAMS